MSIEHGFSVSSWIADAQYKESKEEDLTTTGVKAWDFRTPYKSETRQH